MNRTCVESLPNFRLIAPTAFWNASIIDVKAVLPSGKNRRPGHVELPKVIAMHLMEETTLQRTE
jgi:hypothetical protein